MNQLVKKLIEWCTNQSICQSVNVPLILSLDQSNNQSFIHSINQLTRQSIPHTINGCIHLCFHSWRHKTYSHCLPIHMCWHILTCSLMNSYMHISTQSHTHPQLRHDFRIFFNVTGSLIFRLPVQLYFSFFPLIFSSVSFFHQNFTIL